MEKIRKQILIYSSVCILSFLAGFLFDHYVLCKTYCEVEMEQEEAIIDIGGENKEENKNKPIAFEEGCSVYVDVSGALKKPGVYCLNSGSLVIDAINMAQGLTKEAATHYISRNINLAEPIKDNQKIYFPYEKDLECKYISFTITKENNNTESGNTENITPSEEPEENTENNQCININTATKEQLTTLNGVGDSTAEKIVQGRPYTNVNDLLNVSGIGEATLNKFKDTICI